jgi:CRISPR-associated protein Cmr2
MSRHLKSLLEFNWVSVPWSLAGADNSLNTTTLAEALSPFYPEDESAPGALSSPLFKALAKHAGTQADTQLFWQPNPGTAYAALYDIADRALAATKAAHRSEATNEQGYRCSLCGEREILCARPEHRFIPRGKRTPDNDIWQRRRKSASNSERQEALCGVCAVKREWAGIWQKRIAGDADAGSEFIVSTHVMAATPRLANLNHIPPETADEALHGRRVALPHALYQLCKKNNSTNRILHDIAASEDPDHEDHNRDIDSGLYYGLMLFDGDRMGAWLGGDTDQHIHLVDAWNSVIARDAKKIAGKEKTGTLATLLNSARPLTPSLHATLSATLNDFAIGVVPELINHRYMGQLIYAGGDDVLAMLPHTELLPAALSVRQHWSGASDKPPQPDDRTEPSRGFVVSHRRNQLFRAMGERATGSAGLVLVPAKMPLQRALQHVRAAEKTAKDAGRDRFTVSIVKRAGGTLQWTGEWPVHNAPARKRDGANAVVGRNDMHVLTDFIDLITAHDVSPRFGFQMQAWARQLEGTNPAWQSASYSAMISKSLAWQLDRQGLEYKNQAGICERITSAICVQERPLESLRHLLGVAEFLARKAHEARNGNVEPASTQEQTA